MSRIKFDLRGPALVTNDQNQGLTIERGVQVLDFPITNKSGTASDPQAILRALTMTGSGPGDYINRFPQLFDRYPPPDGGSGSGSGSALDFSFCYVTNQRVTGLDVANNILNAVIRYHSPIGPQSGATITYTVNDSNQQSTIKTYSTADGSQVLSGWYQPGFNNSAHYPAPTSPNDDIVDGGAPLAAVLPVAAQKLVSHRVITATAQTFPSTWNSLKAPFQAARSCINSDTTGVWAPRGLWLYLGPSITYNNAGTVGYLTHTIAEAVGTGRWFAILPYFNQHGEHPADSAAEADLSTAVDEDSDPVAYPPVLGGQIRINGLTMASIQGEVNFATLFSGTVVQP